MAVNPITADDITIDGATQAAYAAGQGYDVNDAGPEVEIEGSATVGLNGLQINGSNTTIRGFVINRFDTGIALLGGDANAIVGNYLGPDATGAVGGVGNVNQGIYIAGATNTTIGGSPADRNVISGNRARGIWIDDLSDGPAAISDGTTILNNYIGTNTAGTAALPYFGVTEYQQIGVAIWDGPDNVIGTPGQGNTVSGNSWYGIYVWGGNATGNVIQGNNVGYDASVSTPVPNGYEAANRAGISISSAPQTLIGGTGAGEPNLIAGNSSHGVVIFDGTGNSIVSNVIHSNGGLGIDLQLDGVTTNDGGDGDSGGNDLLNFPVVTSATETAGTVSLDFDLDVPAGDYRIEVFVNSAADPSGYGEGESLVHSYDVVAHPGGSAGYATTFSGSVGDIISLTSTEEIAAPFGSTSEFSSDHTVTVPDVTAPVITLVGANPQTIEVGSPYVELGATALDDVDGDITGSIVIDATAVNTAVVGSYVVTYDVTDSSGNPATQVTRTVDVVDTTVPVITLVGADPQVHRGWISIRRTRSHRTRQLRRGLDRINRDRRHQRQHRRVG